MSFSITGQHVTITSALHDYASEKIRKIERHFDHLTTIHVVLGVEKTRHTAEATLHGRGAQFHADAEAEDMYTAIDALSAKLDRQVLKHKEKQADHHRENGALKNQALR